jgi:UDP-N-acetylmuramoylalanine--D-glutamate ligase
LAGQFIVLDVGICNCDAVGPEFANSVLSYDEFFARRESLKKFDWYGKKILMLGAARQGQAIARYMSEHGAEVMLSDAKPFNKLFPAFDALKDLPIHWVTGGHPVELLSDVDSVFVTGGADLQIPIIREAVFRNIPIQNDTQVFLSAVQAPVIGITGSSGKTTTTTLTGRIAEAQKKEEQHIWVGGNIGNPLLTFVDDIKKDDIVILELSSFQLEIATISPRISAILNITPNHLDRHGTMEAYIAAKKHIIDYQNEMDIAVLNRDDKISWNLRKEIHGRLMSFGFVKPVDCDHEAAIFLENGMIKRCMKGIEEDLFSANLIRLRGSHNIANVMAACAIASAAGFSPKAMREGIENFSGVDHRLQWVREFNGVNWYNDSIATAPERTMAALKSFDEPLVLLLGGRDKHLPWDELADQIHHRARCAILFGEAAPLIKTALEKAQTTDSSLAVIVCHTLQEAVAAAASQAQAGDVILLSPGGTSYDAFKDFEERGKQFIEWVLQLK